MQGQLFDSTAPPPAPWPARIGALLSGDRKARDRARWQILVVDVVRRLERYVPAKRPFPAVLDGVTLDQIRDAASDEGGDRTVLAAFAAWRADVRQLEVANEKRLGVLAGALETVADLRRRDGDAGDAGIKPEDLDRAAHRIRAHLTDVWNLEPPRPGQSARTWAAQHAVRYDLLPATWREF